MMHNCVMPYKDRIKANAVRMDYYYRNRERINSYRRDQDRTMRLRVIEFYSQGKMCCACCGDKHIEFLAVDHVDGGGTRHLKTIPSMKISRFLIKNNFPEGYQILCHNCNFAKHFYQVCPHRNVGIG